MPFTFAHPAIVLPLTLLPKRWCSLTGLITGSLSPDFEYFLRMKVHSRFSHSLSGLFWFDLPLAIFLAFAFHSVVRNSLLDNLPSPLYKRLARYRQIRWPACFKANIPVVICSVITGAASHLLWDSFTHAHGYFVAMLPALRHTITMGTLQLPVWKILQHTSTVAGLATIVIVLVRLPVDNHIVNRPSLRYWIYLTALSLLITGIRIAPASFSLAPGHILVSFIAAVLLSMMIVPFALPQKKG